MFQDPTSGSRARPRADPRGNLLLRSLADADLDLIAPHFEEVMLGRGQILFEAGDDVTHVTFPIGGAVVTLLVPMQDGRTTETATIGHEGAVGGVVSQGFLPAFSCARVQIAGRALRVGADRLQKAKRNSDPLRNALTRYADCLLAQVLQSVACNAVHPIEQRTAKWLLTLHDRLGSDRLPVTQDTLAEMLGVRRSYMNGVLRRLQDQNLIGVSRGCVSIRQRTALGGAACECYGRVREHFASVLGATYGADGAIVALAPAAMPGQAGSRTTTER